MGDQISRPMQIVLAATLLFAVAWFVALRPKPGAGTSAASSPAASSSPSDAMTTNGILSAPNKARAAVSQSDRRQTQIGAAADSAGADTPTTSTPAPAASAGAGAATATHAHRVTPAHPRTRAPKVRAAHGPDARIARALAAHRVVVVLVFNPRGADDRAVRAQFGSVTTRGGRAVKVAIPLGRLGAYRTLTSRVQITQSPTIVIFDRAGAPHSLQGFVAPTEVNSRIDDALARRPVADVAPSP